LRERRIACQLWPVIGRGLAPAIQPRSYFPMERCGAEDGNSISPKTCFASREASGFTSAACAAHPAPAANTTDKLTTNDAEVGETTANHRVGITPMKRAFDAVRAINRLMHRWASPAIAIEAANRQASHCCFLAGRHRKESPQAPRQAMRVERREEQALPERPALPALA